MSNTTVIKLEKPTIPPVTEKDFIKGPSGRKLTEGQVKQIKRMAYYRACLMRAENKWSPAEEAAYFNGVMAAFHACKSPEQIPAFWVMGRRDILTALAEWKAEGKKLI